MKRQIETPRKAAENADRRKRLTMYILVALSFIGLFIVSVQYANRGPGISLIGSKGPDKTTQAERFGFTNSLINPAYRKHDAK